MSFVSVEHLQKNYASTAVFSDINCEIKKGEFVTLLGPSGCGKSTLLRCIAGLTSVTSGHILLDGQDLVPVSPQKRGIGMVFQSYALFPNMNVEQNVAFGLRMQKVNPDDSRKRVAEILRLVELTDFANRYPHQMSGGQCQRVALARSLVTQPRLLLLDEPLSALDAKVRLTLREEIRRLQQELGITTVFVTHDQEEALSMADRVAVMRGGRLEQCAPPAELYGRPATAFVAEFVGTMNRIPGRTGDDHVVEVLGRRLPIDGEAPVGPEVDVLVRPEAVRVSAAPDSDARIIATAFLGAVTRLTVRLPDDTLVKADLPTHDAAALSAGAGVTLTLSDRPVLVAARAA